MFFHLIQEELVTGVDDLHTKFQQVFEYTSDLFTLFMKKKKPNWIGISPKSKVSKAA